MFYLRKQHTYRNEEGGEGDGGGGESQNEQQTSQDTEVEDKARKMGWTAKDEFKGDPAKWRDATEFVERGENMLPIVRATVKRQERELADLKKTVAEFAEYHNKTEARAYERALKELKTKQIQAVSAGDAEAFVQVDAEMAALHKEATEKPRITVPEPGVHPDYPEWADRNKWIDTDPEMAAYAESYGEFIRKKGSKVEGAAFLDLIAKAVKKEFPEKFTNPRRSEAPSVEGSTPPIKKGGKSYADLPKEAKDACDRFVSKFGVKRDEYVKQYFEGE